MKIGHQIIKLLPILFFALPSCSGRKYEAFGNISKEIVKKICESYSIRVYDSKKEAKYMFIYEDLGKYNDAYVTVLKHDNPETLGLCVIKPVYVNSIHIYDRPETSYVVDVYVDGEGSYDIQDAYDKGKLSDEDINKIAEIGHHDDFNYTEYRLKTI